jgi:rhodanese-related sulfurtransferase
MDTADLPEEISVQTLAAWREAGRDVVLLDVRQGWELDICRFDDSLAIPLAELPERWAEVPRDRPVVVHCHHGARSERAVGWLRHMGVANATNLAGGIDAWAREIDPKMGVY